MERAKIGRNKTGVEEEIKKNEEVLSLLYLLSFYIFFSNFDSCMHLKARGAWDTK